MGFFHLLDVPYYFSKLPGIKNWAKRDCLWCEGQRSGKFQIGLGQELPVFSQVYESKEMAATQCGMYDICHLTECDENDGSQS